MKIRFALLTALTASIGVASGPVFANTIYNVNVAGGTSSAKGTITTDLAVGTLSAANIVGWNLVLKSQGNTFALNGPPLAFSDGSGLTATATSLFFDFGATDNSFVALANSSLSYFCLGGALNNTCSASAVSVSAGGLAEAFSIGAGIQQVASVTATPLPAALPLFVSALGGLGLVGWQRKRCA